MCLYTALRCGFSDVNCKFNVAKTRLFCQILMDSSTALPSIDDCPQIDEHFATTAQ